MNVYACKHTRFHRKVPFLMVKIGAAIVGGAKQASNATSSVVKASAAALPDAAKRAKSSLSTGASSAVKVDVAKLEVGVKPRTVSSILWRKTVAVWDAVPTSFILAGVTAAGIAIYADATDQDPADVVRQMVEKGVEWSVGAIVGSGVPGVLGGLFGGITWWMVAVGAGFLLLLVLAIMM